MTNPNVTRSLEKLVNSPNNRCFGCGRQNPHGLHLHFVQEDSWVRAEFVPGEWHEGWEEIVHGGILATVLDEAMAYCLFFAGVKAMTARMEVRYRDGARQGDVLTVEAHVATMRRTIVDVDGRITRGDQTIAEGHGRYMTVGSLAEP